MSVCVCVGGGGGVGGVEGGRFSFSTCNHVRGAARRLLLDKKDILSLGVHFTADKKRRPPGHARRGYIAEENFCQGFCLTSVKVAWVMIITVNQAYYL